jgi:hypothetical protein
VSIQLGLGFGFGARESFWSWPKVFIAQILTPAAAATVAQVCPAVGLVRFPDDRA